MIANISLAVVLLTSFIWVPAGSAQGNQVNPSFIRQARVMESVKTGLANPVGIAFSVRGKSFQVAEGRAQLSSTTDLVKLTPLANRAGLARIAAAVQNPINMAFDNKANRLLILQAQSNQLLVVQEEGNGNLLPATMSRQDVRRFGLQNPQGMTVDASGTLFVLDAAGPRVVKITPAANGSFAGAKFSEIGLQAQGFSAVRGIAFDPATSHLFVINPVEQKLYELSQDGTMRDSALPVKPKPAREAADARLTNDLELATEVWRLRFLLLEGPPWPLCAAGAFFCVYFRRAKLLRIG